MVQNIRGNNWRFLTLVSTVFAYSYISCDCSLKQEGILVECQPPAFPLAVLQGGPVQRGTGTSTRGPPPSVNRQTDRYTRLKTLLPTNYVCVNQEGFGSLLPPVATNGLNETVDVFTLLTNLISVFDGIKAQVPFWHQLMSLISCPMS